MPRRLRPPLRRWPIKARRPDLHAATGQSVRIALIVALLSLGASPQAQPARAEVPPLRIAIGANWGMPFGKLEGTRLVDGINHDLTHALAQRLGWRLEQVFVPVHRPHERKSDGGYDLQCHHNPAWVSKPEALMWSEPLFDVSDVLVAKPKQGALNRASDVTRGTIVGTVEFYSYPSIQALFDGGHLIREDALSMQGMLDKFARGRSDMAVTNRLHLAWYQQQHPEALRGVQALLTVTRADYHCAIPRSSKVDANLVLKELALMRRDGSIDQLLARYRSGPATPQR